MKDKLLEVQELSVGFKIKNQDFYAVNKISFDMEYGQSLGIVGESGSGKSVTSLATMGLLPRTADISGKILFEGTDLLSLSEAQRQKIRGRDIAMIFQEPMTSLNPLHTCGKQIMEPLLVHDNGLNKEQAKERALELLKLTGIPAPEQRFKEFPHQMSGGMRQRIMIAIALACNPKLLIADEPTTALDVTIQAQILELMKDLKKKLNMGIIMITHDLGIVAEMCELVIVMYTGRIIEYSPIEKIFSEPLHPYTEGLVEAIPQIDHHKPRLQSIEGMVPSPSEMPEGCTFHPRCKYAMERCVKEEPPLYTTEEGRMVKCFKYDPSSKVEA